MIKNCKAYITFKFIIYPINLVQVYTKAVHKILTSMKVKHRKKQGRNAQIDKENRQRKSVKHKAQKKQKKAR